MNRLKKYFYIYKASLNESIQYILGFFMRFFLFMVMVYIFINLWTYMYSDGSNVIKGYSYLQMLWYVLYGEMIWFAFHQSSFPKQITEDVKSGQIAYLINKPYNYIIYLIAKYFGDITLQTIFIGIGGTFFGILLIGKLENFNFLNAPQIILVTLLGALINVLITSSISLLAFWIEDSKPLDWIYSKILIILGILFPVEIFPEYLQGIISCSPAYVIIYGPSKLLVAYSNEMFLKVLTTQIIYIICMCTLIALIYNKGVKKLNVNGG